MELGQSVVLHFGEAICNQASGLNGGKAIRNRGSHKHWNVSPHRERAFSCLNLLQREPSCSLVKLCSTDSPTDPTLSTCQVQSTHTDRQTDPGQQSRGYKSMKWKKKTTTLLHCPSAKPLWNSTAPDRADKVVDQLPWWSVVHSSYNAVERECRLTEVCPQNQYFNS